MAKPDKTDTDSSDPPASGSRLKSFLVMGIIGLVSAAAGFALPQLMSGGASTNKPDESHEQKHEPTPAAKHEGSGNEQAFVPFGEVVVNLAEERLTRYLRVNLTLLVEGANEPSVKEAVEKNKTILKNWLISYLSDKSLEEVRGAAGVNRSRREIQDHFNGLLFPNDSEKIRDVLFEEFTVQ